MQICVAAGEVSGDQILAPILSRVSESVSAVYSGIAGPQMVEAGTYLVPTVAALANIQSGADKVPAYVIEKTMRVAEAHERSIKMFYAAGGKIAMGTDAGTPFNLHGNNAQELRYMVQYGISPMDAIVFSTSNAADLMQLSDQGRVKDGARANLLAVGGNPLENIECVSERANHKFVMCGGTIV